MAWDGSLKVKRFGAETGGFCHFFRVACFFFFFPLEPLEVVDCRIDVFLLFSFLGTVIGKLVNFVSFQYAVAVCVARYRLAQVSALHSVGSWPHKSMIMMT